jgi:hypothetical protein
MFADKDRSLPLMGALLIASRVGSKTYPHTLGLAGRACQGQILAQFEHLEKGKFVSLFTMKLTI